VTQPTETPIAALLRLTNGYQVTQVIHVAVSLGIADHVSDKPQAASEIFVGRDYHWATWGDLLNSVRTGNTGTEHLFGTDIWNYRTQHPEETAIFNAAMASLSRNVVSAIAQAYDFSKFRRIVDVGGANGAFLAGILSTSAGPSGVVFDLPHVVVGADQGLRKCRRNGTLRGRGRQLLRGGARGRGRLHRQVSLDGLHGRRVHHHSDFRTERDGGGGGCAHR
jgi:O-methyltransferase domain